LINSLEGRVPQLDLCPCINVSFSLAGKQVPADHGYLVYSAVSRSVSSLHGIDWLAIELISGFPSGRGLIALPERDACLRLRIPADHYRDVLPLAGKRLDIGGHQIRLGLPVARPLEPASSLYARVVTIKKFTEAEPFIEAVKRKLDSFGVKGRVELPREEVRSTLNRDGAYDQRPDEALRGQRDLSVPPAVAGGRSDVLEANSKLETQNSKLERRYRRRIVTIHGKSVVGFSVAVHDLNDGDSLLLQAGAVKVVSPDDGSVKWQNIFSRRAMGCSFFNPVGIKYQK
jgi:CRISPR-associated protein Cas6